MKQITFLVTLVCCLFLSGCVYSKVKAPYDTDISNTVLGTKVGRASIQSVAWLFAWGDASVSAAAKDGGLQTITHLDSAYEMYLFGLYSKRTTIAYGN